MSDLPEQLRKPVKGYPLGCDQSNTWRDAACELERLQAENERLKGDVASQHNTIIAKNRRIHVTGRKHSA